MQCVLWSSKGAVCSVQCAVCSVQCAVCSVHHYPIGHGVEILLFHRVVELASSLVESADFGLGNPDKL